MKSRVIAIVQKKNDMAAAEAAAAAASASASSDALEHVGDGNDTNIENNGIEDLGMTASGN